MLEAAAVRIEDFDFELPLEQIAQRPLEVRDSSRLLVAGPGAGQIAHHRFNELPALLRRGDLLVVNDTRVFPARLVGRKAETGGKAELLLVRPVLDAPGAALEGSPEASEWICLGQASKGFKPGACLELAEGLRARVTDCVGGGEYRVRFHTEQPSRFIEVLARSGRMPLPPYIEREPTPEDAERYQTVYAGAAGSVAAPTAGLHFTPGLLEAIFAAGIERTSLTLEVGPGTFLPVRDGELATHKMHSERYFIPESCAQAVRQARSEGRRLVAVGTTVARALESATEAGEGELRSGAGETRLFIRPPYAFRQVDALITNFHLPRSTLLMLVSAFLGREATLAAYREAVAAGYRFFSYGDAMLIEGAERGRAR